MAIRRKPAPVIDVARISAKHSILRPKASQGKEKNRRMGISRDRLGAAGYRILAVAAAGQGSTANLIPRPATNSFTVPRLMKFSLASASSVCHSHSSGLMERSGGLMQRSHGLLGHSGGLLLNSQGLLVARHVVLTPDVRVTRRDASRAVRVRVVGARNSALVECRTGSGCSMSRVYVFTLLIWLSRARRVPSRERRIAQRKRQSHPC
jgi:hypothetical protein